MYHDATEDWAWLLRASWPISLDLVFVNNSVELGHHLCFDLKSQRSGEQ